MQRRESTWSPAEGFDKLRWPDSEAIAREYYPRAKKTKAYEGRNPSTGEPVFVAEGISVEGSEFNLPVSPPEGLPVTLTAQFDANGIVEIGVSSDGVEGSLRGKPDHERRQTILEFVASLGKAIGVGPVLPDQPDQNWDVGEVAVHLSPPWDEDDFLLLLRTKRELALPARQKRRWWQLR